MYSNEAEHSKSPRAAIQLKNISKQFYRYSRPVDRLLLQFNWLRKFARYDSVYGLKPLSLEIPYGQVIGLVGRNGAGKSTLLQLVCKTLPPSTGVVITKGNVAALLELGSGFNAEFTGRENVYMSAAIAGLSRTEINERFDEIHEFSGIGDFIDQPVKTYSSGMYVRLAFAVATSVSPDILVIDEALSVGDGAFARKSFDRILSLRDKGATILFCSHSLYQVEALCDRVLWIEGGEIKADNEPHIVLSRYEQFLLGKHSTDLADNKKPSQENEQKPETTYSTAPGSARLMGTEILVDGAHPSPERPAISRQSTLCITVRFFSDLNLPTPGIAVALSTTNGQIVTSVGSWEDTINIKRSASGEASVTVIFPTLGLLKGEYRVGVYLFCERGLHNYDWVDPVATIYVTQADARQGLVWLPHEWCSHNSSVNTSIASRPHKPSVRAGKPD